MTFATLLRASNGPPPEPATSAMEAVSTCDVPAEPSFAHEDLMHELTLMRLAAIEAYERSTLRLLSSFADDVLARELESAPAEIAALAERALATYADHEPVAIVVSPADAERIRSPLPVRAGADLCAGDLVVIVRDGAFESRFTFRVATALARLSMRYDR